MITEVQIIPVRPNNGLVAFATCIYYGVRLSGIAIYTKLEGGYRLTYPTKKVKDASKNIFYPISIETGKKIEDAIIKKYEELINKE